MLKLEQLAELFVYFVDIEIKGIFKYSILLGYVKWFDNRLILGDLLSWYLA